MPNSKGEMGRKEDHSFSALLDLQAPHCAAAATVVLLGWKGRCLSEQQIPKPQLLLQVGQGFLGLERGLRCSKL